MIKPKENIMGVGISFDTPDHYNGFALQNTMYWFVCEVNGGYNMSRRNLYKDLKRIFPEMPKNNKIKAIQWMIDVGILDYTEDDSINFPTVGRCMDYIKDYNNRKENSND